MFVNYKCLDLILSIFSIWKFLFEKKLNKLKFLESLYNPDTSPKKKIEDLIYLAELCIELIQNEEHHAEVS